MPASSSIFGLRTPVERNSAEWLGRVTVLYRSPQRAMRNGCQDRRAKSASRLALSPTFIVLSHLPSIGEARNPEWLSDSRWSVGILGEIVAAGSVAAGIGHESSLVDLTAAGVQSCGLWKVRGIFRDSPQAVGVVIDVHRWDRTVKCCRRQTLLHSATIRRGMAAFLALLVVVAQLPGRGECCCSRLRTDLAQQSSQTLAVTTAPGCSRNDGITATAESAADDVTLDELAADLPPCCRQRMLEERVARAEPASAAASQSRSVATEHEFPENGALRPERCHCQPVASLWQVVPAVDQRLTVGSVNELTVLTAVVDNSRSAEVSLCMAKPVWRPPLQSSAIAHWSDCQLRV